MGSTPANKKSKSKKQANYLAWFEIPAINFQQAVNFYNHIYGIEMEIFSSPGQTMAFFPLDETGIGGAVVSGPGSNPGEQGPLLYLSGGNDLNHMLGKIEQAGGRIIMPKTKINNDGGYFAIFIDSEGNKLALHSSK